MWKPASFGGFQAPRAGRTVVVEDVPSFRPRSAISTARPRFIGHSGENVLFGRRSENRRLPRKRRRMHVFTGSRAEPHFSCILKQLILVRKRMSRRLENLLRRRPICQSAKAADIVMMIGPRLIK